MDFIVLVRLANMFSFIVLFLFLFSFFYQLKTTRNQTQNNKTKLKNTKNKLKNTKLNSKPQKTNSKTQLKKKTKNKQKNLTLTQFKKKKQTKKTIVATIAGNLTLAGSAANIFVDQIMRNHGYREGLGVWNHFKFGFPSTMLTFIVGLGLIVFLSGRFG